MNISRRKFLGGLFAGTLTLLLGRFFNLFRTRNGKEAKYWRKSNGLAG